MSKPAIVAPVAWQNFGKWCLTGQHGMRPIYLSTSPKGVLMDRDPDSDRLIPLTPETPVAREVVRIVNSHADLLAACREAVVFFSRGVASLDKGEAEDAALMAQINVCLDRMRAACAKAMQ